MSVNDVSSAEIPTKHDQRKLTAYHEAAHAVLFNMMDMGSTILVTIEPTGDLDFEGHHQYRYNRPRQFEEPHQMLELHVKDFLHSAAGWLAECRFDPEQCEDGGPCWHFFFEGFAWSGAATDNDSALESLNAAAIILGRPCEYRSYYTHAMQHEIESLAISIMDPACWRLIEAVAEDLLKNGHLRGEDLRRFQIPKWDPETDPAQQLASRWVRRFHRWYPNPKITFLGWSD